MPPEQTPGDLPEPPSMPAEDAASLKEQLRHWLDWLVQQGQITEQTRSVVLYRFALADDQWWTLAAVARQFQITPKDVRVLEWRVVFRARDNRNFGQIACAYLEQADLPPRARRATRGYLFALQNACKKAVTEMGKTIAVRLDPETQRRLEAVCQARDCSAHDLTVEAVKRYLDNEEKADRQR